MEAAAPQTLLVTSVSCVANVCQRQPEEVADVFIVQAIVYVASFPARPYEVQCGHIPELVRYGRLRHVQRHSQVADARFAIGQRGDDPQPGRIAERAKDRGQALRRNAIDHAIA